MTPQRWLRATILLALLSLAACGRSPTSTARSWWSHVQYLADDSLQGRNTGSTGYLGAARYAARKFAEYGATPGGVDTSASDVESRFFQPVGFVSRTIREGESSLEIAREGEVEGLELGQDANLSVGFEAAEHVEAPMVFVGHGLSIPEKDYDEIAGVDLRGKIAVYLQGGPDSVGPALLAHAQKSDIRWKRLREAGAIGLVSIANPKSMDVPWERATLRRLYASMTLADPTLEEEPGLQVAVRVNPAHAERWFERSGHTFAELLALADRKERLPTFPLRGTLRSRVAFSRQSLESPNVVGILPGADSVLKNEYVVISAHLDHLGIGGAVDGDSIYNGAMDNASGVASLLEIARLAKESGQPFRRSVILLAVTGEEKGLQGSRYFAHHPTVPASAIVADINLDMFMPIVPFRRMTVYGLAESDLGDWIVPVAEREGVQVVPDDEPQRNLFTRSDQYSFIRQGVPALAFKIAPADSNEKKLFKTWLTERYHAPSDDLDQPVNLESAEKFTRLLYAFAREVANRDEVARWKEKSFFRRFAVADSAPTASVVAP